MSHLIISVRIVLNPQYGSYNPYNPYNADIQSVLKPYNLRMRNSLINQYVFGT